MSENNFFKNLFKKETKLENNKTEKKEEEHDITIEKNQSEFNERLENDKDNNEIAEEELNKEQE